MRNYFSFLGRASREDYFKFRLLNTCLKTFTLFTIISLVSIMLDHTYQEYLQLQTIFQKDFPNSIYWLSFILIFCIILRLIFSFRLYALTIRRLNDIYEPRKWYLCVLIPRQIYILLWIIFIVLIFYGFIIAFEQIAAADNISPKIIAEGIAMGFCCPPLYGGIEYFVNGGIKMWLYLLIIPFGIMYYFTHCAMTILMSAKSKSEQNIFGIRKLPTHPKHGLFYLSSLIAEVIYTVFFLSFILINWLKIIWILENVSAADNINFIILHPLFDVFGWRPDLEIFFYVTLGLVILNTLFFNIYFKYSKK